MRTLTGQPRGTGVRHRLYPVEPWRDFERTQPAGFEPESPGCEATDALGIGSPLKNGRGTCENGCFTPTHFQRVRPDKAESSVSKYPISPPPAINEDADSGSKLRKIRNFFRKFAFPDSQVTTKQLLTILRKNPKIPFIRKPGNRAAPVQFTCSAR